MIENWLQSLSGGSIDVDDVRLAILASLLIIIPRATLLIVAAIEAQTRRLLQAYRVSQSTPPTEDTHKGANE